MTEEVNVTISCHLDSCNPSTLTNATCPPSDATTESGNFLTPTEDYYYNYVLQQSGHPDVMGGVSWKLSLSLLVAWTIVCLVLIRGISSLGKVTQR